MASMMKPNHTSRRRRFSWRIALLPVILLLAIAAFVVESRSGWADLYRAAGISLDGPDAALLAQSPTTVTVLDIGQGDAVLLGQDGEYCLIDTGPSDAKDDLVRDLQLAGIAKLDYLVLTHPHADHTGGAKEVLRNFSVGQLLIPPWDAEASGETADWPRGLFELAEQQGTAVTVAEDGAVYSLGSGTLTILQGGESELYNTDDSSAHVNNASLCTMFEAGSFRYLSTGDAEAQAEQRLVDRYGKALHATLFKAGHHGSSTSSTDALLQVVQPQAAAISCGLNNDYGHPHASALQRLTAAGADIYRTDTMGTVTFTYQNDTLTAAATDTLDAAA